MIAVGVGLLFAIVGTIVAAFAALPLVKRVNEVKAHAARVVDVERAKADVARLQRSLETAGPLLERAKTAIDRINDGLRDLKLPQAVIALRTAGAAIRLLVNGR